MPTNRLLLSFGVWLLFVGSASACPNLAGRYVLRGDEAIAYFTVRQKGCERVEIDWKNDSLGKTFAAPTKVFIPDGKAHGKGVPVSRWVGDKLQVGAESAHVYYSVDSSGNLHMSDGRTYPQCKGPCDETAKREE
jgi:hypothetical protein